MRVNACVSSGSSQVLVLPVGNVLVRSGIPVLLGQTKVYYIDQVSFLSQTHQEIVGLDISMDEVLGMNILYPTNLRKREREKEDYQSSGNK